MKTWRVWGMVAGLMLAAGTQARAAADWTVFVVPARYSVLQVMFDVTAVKPAELVSYQGNATTATPLLHVWREGEWVAVSVEDFRTGRLARQAPTRVVLAGNDEILPAVLMQSAQNLAPAVIQVKDIDTAALVNAAGKLMKFKRGEWQWFSERYNMGLSDASQAARKGWYEEPRSSKKFSPPPFGGAGEQPPPAPVVPEAKAPAAPKAEPKSVVPAPVMPPTAAPAPAPAKPAAPEAGIK